jgi:hypothetical protein
MLWNPRMLRNPYTLLNLSGSGAELFEIQPAALCSSSRIMYMKLINVWLRSEDNDNL